MNKSKLIARLIKPMLMSFILLILMTSITVFGSKEALAADTVPLAGTVNASTYIGSLNTTANLPNGSFDATLNLSNDQITGNLSLPEGSINTKVFGFVPMAATFQIVPVGQLTGSVNLSTLKVDVSTTFNIKLISAEVFGLPVNIVGNNCQTASPTTANLSGSVDPSNLSVDLSGNYSIPQFQNCGFSTFLVNLLVPGNNNSITAQIS